MFCGYCGKENSKDYSFCAGCGKPLESGIPNQPIQLEDKSKSLINTQPQENQDAGNPEDSRPQSKYISVTWWKKCDWPWQARSLDGKTVLGRYQTELEAAEVVAKHHGVNIADLLMERQTSEIEREENRCLLLKRVLDKNNNLPKALDGSLTDEPESLSEENFKEPFGVAYLPEKKPPPIWKPITLVICAYIWGVLNHFNWEVARAIFMITRAPDVLIDAIGNIFPIVLGLIHLAISQFFKSKRNSYSRRYIIIYWSIAAFAVLLLASIYSRG